MIKLSALFITFTFLLTNSALSQSSYNKEFLDSVFTEFVKIKQPFTGIDAEKPLSEHSAKSKCGLFTINFVKQNIDLFTPQQQQLLKTLAGRPDTTQSIVSSSGKFRIHYYTSDSQKPKYIPSLSISENLSLISAAIDSAYNFEVNYLGYPSPPSDNGQGGDNLYDIYIMNLGGSLYGYTELENDLGLQKYTSFMVIDNDYSGYYSSGINGAKATLAHEFHHGIQMGNYILRFEDTFFYEITSTSMEEFVYDDVNDYYAYMSSYFLNPQNAFAENDGYNLAIWNLFLKENFGFGLIKRQWELMPSQRAMLAINTSIDEYQSNFKHELNQFGIWTYFTKHRAVNGKYFEEAAKYPVVRPISTISFTSPDEIVSVNSKATANNFIRFTNVETNNDTLFVLITNGDIQGSMNSLSQQFSFTYYLYDHEESGAVQIDSNYYSKFSTANPFLWSVAELFDTVITVEPQLKTDYPYPAPFSYNTHLAGKINIPVTAANDNTVGLYIFNTAMELIYSNDAEEIDKLNKNVISWTVKDNQGEKLASGVYFYVIKNGDDIQKGKLVILHD
ncbi:MAG: hypothetical protein HXY50_10495 [Ignavibacteriaceae bacterium]|nr:hypothetical protein [Ignavibacteriaceae bacterium]